MNKSENNFVHYCFLSLLIACSALILCEYVSRPLDMLFVYIFLMCSFSFLVISNSHIVDATHLLFMFSLFSLTFLSYNRKLLLLSGMIFAIIISSRLYFGHCVINKKQNGVGNFLRFNKMVNIEGTISQGNILFSVMLLITLYRCYYSK